MGVWADRTWLASQGWRTDMRIEKPCPKSGRRTFGLWAKTWRWNDRVAEVCLHAHGSLDPDANDAPSQLDLISAILREACTRAREEFLDEVPCQVLSKGQGKIELAVSDWDTLHFRKQPRKAFVPDVIDFLVDGPESGAYVSGILDGLRIAGEGMEYCDDLDPYAERRLVRDSEPAIWQFLVRPAIRRWQGQIIKAERYKTSEVSTRLIQEGNAGDLARAACANYVQHFIDFAPGGRLHGATHNALPPGHQVFIRPEPPESDVEDLDL